MSFISSNETKNVCFMRGKAMNVINVIFMTKKEFPFY